MSVCEQCGKEHDGKFGSGRFCCRSCSNKWVALHQSPEAKARKVAKGKKNLRNDNQLGKPHTEETKRKISESVSKVMSTPEMRYRQSISHRGKSMSLEARKKLSSKNKENYERGIIKGWPSRKVESYAESFWKSVLTNNDISFTQELPLRKREDLGVDESGCYFLDFLLTDQKVDLEIDGSSHYIDGRKEHDTLRDTRLREAGYKVYRVRWVNPSNNPLIVKEDIDKFLNWYKNL